MNPEEDDDEQLYQVYHHGDQEATDIRLYHQSDQINVNIELTQSTVIEINDKKHFVNDINSDRYMLVTIKGKNHYVKE